MTNNSVKRHKVLKKWVRISLAGVILVLLSVALFMIITSFGKKEKRKVLYSYNISQNVDYKVNLYDNSFIKSNYLGKNEMYISDLIKSMDISFMYNFSSSKMNNWYYDYSVLATIDGEYQLSDDSDAESKVWTKEYPILEKKDNVLKNKNNIDINEHVSLDYKFYNEEVSKFRQQLKLSITANLLVGMKVDIYNDADKKHLVDSKKTLISMPLNQQAFKITEDYQDKYNGNVLDNNINSAKFDYRKMICGIFIGCIGVFLLIFLCKDLFSLFKKNVYTKKLSKILKDYDDIIVEVLTPVNEEDLSVIEVKNFDEMVDLEEELRIPIMFFEEIENVLGVFTIVHNNMLYKYVLSNDMEENINQ